MAAFLKRGSVHAFVNRGKHALSCLHYASRLAGSGLASGRQALRHWPRRLWKHRGSQTERAQTSLCVGYGRPPFVPSRKTPQRKLDKSSGRRLGNEDSKSPFLKSQGADNKEMTSASPWA